VAGDYLHDASLAAAQKTPAPHPVAALRKNGGRDAGAQLERSNVRRSRRSRTEDTRPSDDEFALRLGSIDDLFWPLDGAPVAERKLNEDVRWALLDHWERVRRRRPRELLIYAPETDRSRTDLDAITASIRRGLHSASGRLRDIDHCLGTKGGGPDRHRRAVRLDRRLDCARPDERERSDRGRVPGHPRPRLGALWRPAAHFVGEVVPHLFNRRRYAEFADIDVRIVWTS
jgi:hypothetical protein